MAAAAESATEEENKQGGIGVGGGERAPYGAEEKEKRGGGSGGEHDPYGTEEKEQRGAPGGGGGRERENGNRRGSGRGCGDRDCGAACPRLTARTIAVLPFAFCRSPTLSFSSCLICFPLCFPLLVMVYLPIIVYPAYCCLCF